MRSMQNALDATHHIKYNARLQYGLFLKVKALEMIIVNFIETKVDYYILKNEKT